MNKIKQETVSAEPIWSRYIHAKGKKVGLPIAGNYELTARCNFDCKMCYVHNSDGMSELTADQWIDIGRQSVDRGMVFLLLTGGEPFVRKDFLQIYTALKKMGLLISINTNASLINAEIIEYLIENPPLRMNISLYGCSNETYDRLCGKPVFDVVSQNIIKLREAGISIRLNSSITPYNSCDIQGLYQFAKQLNVPLKATTYMFPPVRVNGCRYGESLHRFTAEEAAKFMLKCQEQYLTPEKLAKNYINDLLEDEDCCDEKNPMRCRAGSTAFWITWDGRMLPCGMFPTQGISVVDNDFNSAWESVRKLADSISLPAECGRCLYKNKCPACAAACFAETGKTDIKPEYVCKMTKKLNEIIAEKYSS